MAPPSGRAESRFCLSLDQDAAMHRTRQGPGQHFSCAPAAAGVQKGLQGKAQQRSSREGVMAARPIHRIGTANCQPVSVASAISMKPDFKISPSWHPCLACRPASSRLASAKACRLNRLLLSGFRAWMISKVVVAYLQDRGAGSRWKTPRGHRWDAGAWKALLAQGTDGNWEPFSQRFASSSKKRFPLASDQSIDAEDQPDDRCRLVHMWRQSTANRGWHWLVFGPAADPHGPMTRSQVVIAIML